MPASWTWPQEQSFSLPNGLKTSVIRRPDEAAATVALFVPAGEAAEPVNAPGVSALLAGWLRGGTSRREGLPLELRVEQVGADLAIEGDRRGIMITCTSVQPMLAGCVRLVADVALAPAFDESTLLPVRAHVANQLRQNLSSASGKASAHLGNALFGDAHPWGRSVLPDDVGARTADQIRAFWSAWFRPNLSRLVIAGDVAAAEANKVVAQAFGDWARAGTRPRVGAKQPIDQGLRVLLVDQAGANQTTVMFGQRVRAQTAQQRAALEAAVFMYGGAGLGSRLALDVATQGLISAGGATLEPIDAQQVLLRVTLATSAEKAWPALLAAAQQLKDMKDHGPSPAELAEAKARSSALDPFVLQSGAGLADAVARTEGGSVRQLATLAEQTIRVDARMVKAALRAVSPETFTIVMVGPAARIAPELQRARVRFERVAFEDPISSGERKRRAAVHASAGQDQSDARALIIRGLAVQGGAPAFRAVRTMKLVKQGKRREAGVVTEVLSTSYHQRPDLVRVEQQAQVSGQIARSVFVVSREGVRGGDGKGPLQALPAENVERLQAAVFEDVTFLLLNVLDAQPRLPMQVTEPLEEQGKRFDGIMVKVPSGQWLTLFFDAETHLLARVRSADAAGGYSEQRLSDYREVQGLRLAWRQTLVGPNPSEATLQEVQVNPPLDPQLFR